MVESQTELKRFDFPKLVDGGTSYGIQKCDAPDLFRVRLSQYIQQREYTRVMYFVILRLMYGKKNL